MSTPYDLRAVTAKLLPKEVEKVRRVALRRGMSICEFASMLLRRSAGIKHPPSIKRQRCRYRHRKFQGLRAWRKWKKEYEVDRELHELNKRKENRRDLWQFRYLIAKGWTPYTGKTKEKPTTANIQRLSRGGMDAPGRHGTNSSIMGGVSVSVSGAFGMQCQAEGHAQGRINGKKSDWPRCSRCGELVELKDGEPVAHAPWLDYPPEDQGVL